MADAAHNFIKVIKQLNTDTSSTLVALTVKQKDPIMLSDGDKLMLTKDFIVFDNYIDTSKIEIGDKFRAITLNYGQLYYIIDIISSDKELDKYIQRIKRLEDRY